MKLTTANGTKATKKSPHDLPLLMTAVWPACVKTHCCFYKFQKRFTA
jgi:hypothetical protein